ncbi:MAG: acyl-CoA thioesterase [Rhodopirellula sp.]|nr:acyl-CoA thioesterase [Rhodopirellula sp.]
MKSALQMLLVIPVLRYDAGAVDSAREKMMELLQDFPVIIQLPVQWGDQDALGHVNNVVFFRWWESSRIAYAERIDLLGTGRTGRFGTVLASMTCDFRKQVVYPDNVLIGARIGRVGNSSLHIQHRLVSEQLNAVAAEAVSVMVSFDFEQQCSCRISDEIRAAVCVLEPGRIIDGLSS